MQAMQSYPGQCGSVVGLLEPASGGCLGAKPQPFTRPLQVYLPVGEPSNAKPRFLPKRCAAVPEMLEIYGCITSIMDSHYPVTKRTTSGSVL